MKETILGIWAQDMSLSKMQEYYNIGIKGAYVGYGVFWETSNNNHQVAQKLMKEYVDELIKMGYIYLLIDVSWGLYPLIAYDDTHIKIIKQFQSYEQCHFIHGEPYNLVETGLKQEDGSYKKFTEDELGVLLLAKYSAVEIYTQRNKNLIIDIQGRLWNKADMFLLPDMQKTTSSYEYKVWELWNEDTPFTWSSGELQYHLNCFFYKQQKSAAEKAWINVHFIYMANVPGFTADGWENKIWKTLGLLNKIRSWNLNKFIKYFGSK